LNFMYRAEIGRSMEECQKHKQISSLLLTLGCKSMGGKHD